MKSPTKKKPAVIGSARASRHRVRDELQNMILSGRFSPGSKLPQMQLAKKFGVAQGVIRESLLELKACGLVETVDNLGVFVSKLDADRLIQAYQIREVLEGLAARLCCHCAGRQDLQELRHLAERIYCLGTESRGEKMGALDREFHHRIIQLSRNDMLERLTESYRVLGKVLRVNRDFKEVHDEHLAIIHAIERNRPDDAERKTREHIRVAVDIIATQMKEGTFVPKWV